MKKIISSLLSKQINSKEIKDNQIEKLIEIPPNIEMGDYAFPCFILSKQFKKSPAEIAKELQLILNNKLPKELSEVKAIGPYINFFVYKKVFAEDVIKRALNKTYGNGKSENRKSIMVEFSQPNTHKAFHVGHIRGTALGESLARIFESQGSKVIRANYSGDTGMHIAKWIWCYQKYHSEEKLSNDESWIASIYVDAVKRIAKNEKFQEEVNEINNKIEKKSDKKINELWKKTRMLSIDSWKKIYDDFGTKFDRHYFESEVEARAKELAKELVNKGIAVVDEGATIMNLKQYNLGVWVLLRNDGTVLYSAKDIALVERKLKDHKLDNYLVITADEQNLHFQQLFKTLELIGIEGKNKFLHASYAPVRLPQGKMSSRTGENILYSDFRKELVTYAKKEIKKRFPKINEKDLNERGLKISVAAMKYPMLCQSSNRVIIFDKEQAMKFEGDSGPYLQYSYARANSITRKIKTKKPYKIFEVNEQEFKLARKISEFPEIVSRAADSLSPNLIANYSYELAQTFNEFYHACPVIKSENESFRLKLVEAFKTTIKNSLYLLGIEAMEEM
ncbi:MAG TPA: arginine--tRNA ligase [Candidatus Paceibacterota bacterium]|nr:arginine--tRNA ligase [Candidatus Paceibacterota bacterium]